MSNAFVDKIYAFVKENDLFPERCHLVVGVSGGADSMALLNCLYNWPDYRVRVTAVHIHHGLRGMDADRDAFLVKKYCESHSIRYMQQSVDVAAIAEEQHISIETAGRAIRYDTFEEIRRRVGADYILTAHTASDQMETVLMHLVRGCGTDGLSGIPVKRDLIRRPLLCCTREEIEDYCIRNRVPYAVDETNFDMQYTRNRVRHEVLPMLRGINPAVDTALLRVSQHSAEDANLLRSMALEVLQRSETEDVWDISFFVEQPQPIRRRMIAAILRDASVPSIEEAHIVAVDNLLHCGKGKASLPGCVTIEVGQGRMFLYHTSTTARYPKDKPLNKFPYTGFFGATKFSVTVQDAEVYRNVHNLFANPVLDYDKIQGQLYVRCRREGDYLHPADRHIGKTLKKLMNEWRIPANRRATFPIVCDDAGVIMVPGYACDERVKPTDDTKHFLVWHTRLV